MWIWWKCLSADVKALGRVYEGIRCSSELMTALSPYHISPVCARAAKSEEACA